MDSKRNFRFVLFIRSYLTGVLSQNNGAFVSHKEQITIFDVCSFTESDK